MLRLVIALIALACFASDSQASHQRRQPVRNIVRALVLNRPLATVTTTRPAVVRPVLFPALRAPAGCGAMGCAVPKK